MHLVNKFDSIPKNLSGFKFEFLYYEFFIKFLVSRLGLLIFCSFTNLKRETKKNISIIF